MLARPAPHAFTPGAPVRIAVAADGATAAILEPRRVVAVGLPDCSVLTEVAIDDAGACELAWLGTRLLVLTRDATHTRAQLVDAAGEGRVVADIRLEAPVRLIAAVGAHALVAGAPGTAVLTAGDAHLTPYQFLSRAQPSAGGAAGGMFVVALPGTIEEWDPASRTPKRRLRLPRPAAITALGGTERLVWMTTQQEPARVDVLPLVNRGQPRAHELPEAIAAVHGHPRADYLLCVGAETGRLYGVDLEGRARLRTIAVEGLDHGAPMVAALALGRGVAVLAAQAGRPLALLTLDGREHEPSRSASSSAASPEPTRSSLYDEPEPVTPPAAAVVVAPAASAAPVVLPPHAEPAEPAPAIATPAFEDVPPEPAPPRPRVAWATGAGSLRERLRGRDEATPARSTWRDDAALWADAVRGGTFDRAAPHAPPVEALAARFELPKPLVPALVLLYGAHLAGHDGLAPVAVSRVLGRTWDEALGRGQLAALGLARYERSRVILAEPLQRVLDELPPGAGLLVGSLGESSLLGACAVVAEPDEPLAMIAARLAPRLGGAILAAHDGADPAGVVLEARARAATPLVRHPIALALDRPALVVVAHEGLAEQLGLPVL